MHLQQTVTMNDKKFKFDNEVNQYVLCEVA